MTNNTNAFIQNYFGNYLSSKAGKQRIFEQVSNIVAERKAYALSCVDYNSMYSATNAALGAWAEATHHSLTVHLRQKGKDMMLS